MRKRIFEIIEPGQDGDKISFIYNAYMVVAIVLSFIPLLFKTMPPWYEFIDAIVLVSFIVDYILRFITNDFRFKSSGKEPFLLYPISKMALIDLISILPWIFPLTQNLKLFRILRLARSLRVFKVYKYIRDFKGMSIIVRIIRRQKDAILVCCYIALGYVFASAVVIFNVEPETFDSFFDALYWSVVSLTTVGYGDIYPITLVGRIVAMISSVFGIAVVAMPAGVITAGFFDELKEDWLREYNKEEIPQNKE